MGWCEVVWGGGEECGGSVGEYGWSMVECECGEV